MIEFLSQWWSVIAAASLVAVFYWVAWLSSQQNSRWIARTRLCPNCNGAGRIPIELLSPDSQPERASGAVADDA